jgi:CMP-N-acetylneuraminic acid synthetase
VSRIEVLQRGLLVSDGDVRGYEMPAERSFDIDTTRDLALARLLADDEH